MNRRHAFHVLATTGLLFSFSAVEAEPWPGVGEVNRYAEAMDRLVAADAVIERLTDEQFTWSEGPVWVPGGDYVLFSDVPENVIWKWSVDGGLESFLQPSALVDGRPVDPSGQGSNGLYLDLEGQVLVADHGSRSLYRLDPGSKMRSVLASDFEGKRFNSPNDLVVSRVRWPGTVFFTDPPYGLTGDDNSELKEIDFNGVYRLDPDGEVTLLEAGLPRPNGIALSPDETTLYVANSFRENTVWMAYALDEAGGIAGEGRVFASAQAWADGGAKGLPDGMAVDIEGNLWATGPGGVYVIDPDGNILGLIDTGTAVANCAFGGPEGRTLYLTSHTFLARIETNVKGLGLP